MPSQAASRRSSSHQTGTGKAEGRDDSVATTSLLDDPKYAIATNFMATMLQEVVIDTALLVHAQVKRQRRTEGKAPGGCPVCKTSCQRPADDKQSGADEKAIKREATEDGEASPAPTQETVSSTPKGLEMYQNNPLLACLVCSRQVSANRYAQHLASCVGVGKGSNARRKGKNGGSASSFAKDRMKIKTALENRKKANFQTQSNRNTPTPTSRPEQDSMSGASDDETSTRRNKTLADSLGLNGNGKRALSPTGETSKRAKHSTPPRNSALPFAPSALGSSLPVTGSPLNPHRNSKPITVVDDEEDANADEADADEDDDEAEDEEEDENDDDDDEEEEDEEDDEDDASVALANGTDGHTRNGSIADSFEDDSDDAASEAISEHPSFISKTRNSKTDNAIGAIERSKGSDGEYIDVESASAHSEVDDDF